VIRFEVPREWIEFLKRVESAAGKARAGLEELEQLQLNIENLPPLQTEKKDEEPPKEEKPVKRTPVTEEKSQPPGEGRVGFREPIIPASG
jgi:hypothetical protein